MKIKATLESLKSWIKKITSWILNIYVVQDDRKTYYFIMTLQGKESVRVVRAKNEGEARLILREALGRQRIPKNTKVIVYK